MQGALSEKHLASRIDKVDMPGLPAPYQGKVRENFSLADGRRVIIASDRLSAFDQILTAIPFKGEVLTQIARFWFEETADICPNHVLNYPDPNVLVARELRMLPVEIVVRNYLTGTTSTSIWPAYKAGQRELYGVIFPDGMKENQKLAEPVLTPTTKALDGGHDEPISPSQVVARGLMTAEQWAVVSAYSLKIFARGQKIAADRGLILVDTKYEFGVDRDGKILLADEIHTPDSSRYWLADSYPAAFENGQSPQSFDKDFIRRWVTARCDPYKDPIPVIPNDVILKTAQVYIDAFEKITGKTFVVGAQSDEPLKRMQKNLQPYIAA